MSVLRLDGDDASVAAVAEAALTSVGPAGRERVEAVRRLHQQRRQVVAAMGVERPGASEPTPRAEAGGAGRAWWTAALVAMLAAVVGSAGMLPPRHAQSPALIMQVSPPAIVVAAVLLVVLAAWVPAAARRIPSAMGLAIAAGAFAALALAINVLRQQALVEAGGETGVLVWTVGAAVVVVAAAVAAIRTRPDRSSSGRSSGADRAWRDAAAELRRDAERLERRGPDVDDQAWTASLDALRGRADESALAQAREVGPWRWLVWSAYDGEIALPALARA